MLTSNSINRLGDMWKGGNMFEVVLNDQLYFTESSKKECSGLWCQEGRCVSQEATCDNITHCLNAMDEQGCGEKNLH